MIAQRSYTPPPAPLAQYQAMLGALGIQRCVLVQASIYGTDNRCMLDALSELGTARARGIAVIDGAISDSELQAMDKLGIRGVRFNTLTAGGPAVSVIGDIARRVAGLGWHIECWTSPDTLASLEPVLRELPMDVVLDHMGQVDPRGNLQAVIDGALGRLLDTGRGWLKLSAYRCSLAGPPYDDAGEWAKAFITRWPERCVWGSDWPHPMVEGLMPDDGELLDLLGDWSGTESNLRRILIDNPSSLYKF